MFMSFFFLDSQQNFKTTSYLLNKYFLTPKPNRIVSVAFIA